MDIPTKEKIYRVLRDYQDGKLNDGCVSNGCLDIPLSNVFNRIVSIVEDAPQPIIQDGRAECTECEVIGFTIHHKPGCKHYE